MIRKTLIAVAAAGTLLFGIGGAAQTASADHIRLGIGIGFGFGSGHHHGHHMHGHHMHDHFIGTGHYGAHCHHGWVKKWSKKKHRNIRIRVRDCHNHWHRLGHH
jgi:hypothetical protein